MGTGGNATQEEKKKKQIENSSKIYGWEAVSY